MTRSQSLARKRVTVRKLVIRIVWGEKVAAQRACVSSGSGEGKVASCR